MKRLISIVITVIASALLWANEVSIDDGKYVFAHKYAEHPNMESISLDAVVSEGKITLTNNDKADVFPLGILDQGEMYWHKLTGQWIVASSPEDKTATEVGGCTDGPSVIDLVNKVYWTC